MKLINRDESRHIAVDFHMSEYYASPEYTAWLATQPSKPIREQVRAARALVGFMRAAQPFFRDVFFAPMELVDPDGRRLHEAFKRIQLLGVKTGTTRPFARFMRGLFELFNHPRWGRHTGWLVERVMGIPPGVIRRLYSADEERTANAMSYSDMADEALTAKTLH